MTNRPGILSIYAHTAHLYEQRIIPAFGPLAASLADWIARCVDAHQHYSLHDPFDLDESQPTSPQSLHGLTALDLGTGTGILARTLARSFGRVIALDLSPAMLGVAAHEAQPNMRLVRADLHDLPLRRGAAQVITTSFGLNASTPRKSLRAVAQALFPGDGIFAFQEWGAEDDCSRVLDKVLAELLPDGSDTNPALDEAIREFYASPKPWYDDLQYPEDFYEMLKQVGFDLVWVREAPFATVHFPSLDVFITYKTAWPQRRLAIEALDADPRTALYAEIRKRLGQYTNGDGSLDWKPPLFRVFAVR